MQHVWNLGKRGLLHPERQDLIKIKEQYFLPDFQFATSRHVLHGAVVLGRQCSYGPAFGVYLPTYARIDTFDPAVVRPTETLGNANGITAAATLAARPTVEVVVKPGSTFELECKAGKETSDINWTHSRKGHVKDVSTSLKKSRLVIKNARKKNGGTYTCKTISSLNDASLPAEQISLDVVIQRCPTKMECKPFQNDSGCEVLDEYCVNKLDSFIQTVVRLVNSSGEPFVFFKSLVLQGCDRSGHALKEMRGIAVANVSYYTLKYKSPLEVHFYEQEPIDKPRMWNLTASINHGASKTTHLKCSGGPVEADVPPFYIPRQASPTACATPPITTSETATTETNGRFDTLKNGDTEDNFLGTSLAVGFSSFIAGIFTVLAAQFLLSYIRTQKCCLGKTMTGASLSVTEQLNHDNNIGHAGDMVQNVCETWEGAHMHTAVENPYQTLDYTKPVQYNAEKEHVYTGRDGQTWTSKPSAKPQQTHCGYTDQTSGTENVYFVLEKEGNDAFGAQMSSPGIGTDNTYFVLEKEAQMTPQTGATENAYFVLEKEAQMSRETGVTDNTCFVQEKEAQMPPQTDATENMCFVLGKEAHMSPQTGETENTYFVHGKEAQMTLLTDAKKNTDFVLEKETQISPLTGGKDNLKTGH